MKHSHIWNHSKHAILLENCGDRLTPLAFATVEDSLATAVISRRNVRMHRAELPFTQTTEGTARSTHSSIPNVHQYPLTTVSVSHTTDLEASI